VLQCVAVCCSVLQCVAVCCSVLQCVAVCCSVLQWVHITRLVSCVHIYVCMQIWMCRVTHAKASCFPYIFVYCITLYSPCYMHIFVYNITLHESRDKCQRVMSHIRMSHTRYTYSHVMGIIASVCIVDFIDPTNRSHPISHMPITWLYLYLVWGVWHILRTCVTHIKELCHTY